MVGVPVWDGGGIAGSGWEDGAGNLPGLPEMGGLRSISSGAV